MVTFIYLSCITTREFENTDQMTVYEDNEKLDITNLMKLVVIDPTVTENLRYLESKMVWLLS